MAKLLTRTFVAIGALFGGRIVYKKATHFEKDIIVEDVHKVNYYEKIPNFFPQLARTLVKDDKGSFYNTTFMNIISYLSSVNPIKFVSGQKYKITGHGLNLPNIGLYPTVHTATLVKSDEYKPTCPIIENYIEKNDVVPK